MILQVVTSIVVVLLAMQASWSAVLQGGIVTSPPPTRTLTLSQCLDLADRFNKEILTARWNVTIARAAMTIAGAVPNPQFLIQEGFGQAFTSIVTGQTEQFGWTEDIQTAGKRSKKVAQAKANYQLVQTQLNALRFDVHNRVRRVYAELVAAEAYANLVDSQRKVAEQLLAIAQKRFASGKAPQTEVLQAELIVSQFDTLHNQSQIRLQQDSAALALIIGETPQHVEVIDVVDNGLFKLSAAKTEVVPSPSEPLPSPDQLLATAVALRPDLQAAAQQIVVSQKALALAKAQRIPDVNVGAGFIYAHWAKNQIPEVAPAPNWIGNGAYVTVSAENPIFYQHQGEVQQAAATLRQSQRRYDLQRLQVATDVVSAYSEVSVAQKNIFVFQNDLLPVAAQVAQLARRGYEVGKTDLSTAIFAQQQYQQTLSSYFDAVVSYQSAWADLEKATGVALRP